MLDVVASQVAMCTYSSINTIPLSGEDHSEHNRKRRREASEAGRDVGRISKCMFSTSRGLVDHLNYFSSTILPGS